MLEKLKIILSHTTHPGNIGATARAMKTMGLGNLVLVAPQQFPSAEVTARAAGADDILAGARVYDTLAEAVADCTLVAATSARVRTISWPEYTPDSAAALISDRLQQRQTVAVVFGQERSGLSNEEIDLCNFMIRIPTNPEFSSLNVASAVQIISYEINRYVTDPDIATRNGETREYVSTEKMELLYQHLETVLAETGFLDTENPGKLMRRLRRLFNRAELDMDEYNILRGILTAMESALENRK